MTPPISWFSNTFSDFHTHKFEKNNPPSIFSQPRLFSRPAWGLRHLSPGICKMSRRHLVHGKHVAKNSQLHTPTLAPNKKYQPTAVVFESWIFASLFVPWKIEVDFNQFWHTFQICWFNHHLLVLEDQFGSELCPKDFRLSNLKSEVVTVS